MVAEGQLGAWQPIAAEQVGSGYQVAWKLGGNVWIWDVDSGGDYVSNAVFAHGSQWALQSAEPGFGQDLNGDGFVGPITTAIEASGQTRLYDVADAYFLYPEGGSPVGSQSRRRDGGGRSARRLAADRSGAGRIGLSGGLEARRQRLDLGRRQRRQLRLQRRLRPRQPVGAAIGGAGIWAGPEWRRFRRTHYDGDRSVRRNTPVRCGGCLFPVSGRRLAGRSQGRRRDGGGRSARRLAADSSGAGRIGLSGGLEARRQHLDLGRRQRRQLSLQRPLRQWQPMGAAVGGDQLRAGPQRRWRCRNF